jgi:hypothetical protein
MYPRLTIVGLFSTVPKSALSLIRSILVSVMQMDDAQPGDNKIYLTGGYNCSVFVARTEKASC